MNFTFVLNDKTTQSLINDNTVKSEKRFFIRQADWSKKILNRASLQKNKPDDFNSRLGKQDFIQEEIPMDKLIRKQRYLNTTSNKKKVWAFNQDSNIIDLEQIRLLYNENVSIYNRNAEKHSNPN